MQSVLGLKDPREAAARLRAGATDAVFAASRAAIIDDGARLFAVLSFDGLGLS